MKPKCAITGASGYVGSRVAAHMREHGWEVLSLTSREGAWREASSVPYFLEGDVSPDTFRGVDALIHCAYDFRPIVWEEIYRINVCGAIRLFDSAQRAGVKIMVFISTIGAYDGCKSLYGKAKLAIENEMQKAGGIIVRPGLVYGKNAGGMLGALNRVVAKSKVIPLIGAGDWMMYLSFEEDLCALINRLCTAGGGRVGWPITAASSRGMLFRDVLSELARAHGNKPVFIPVPWLMIWLGLRMLEVLGIRAGFRSDSILGLVYPNPQPSFSEIGEMGMTFRDFQPELLQ